MGFAVIDVYVEHNIDNPEIMDASELDTNIDDDYEDAHYTDFRSANIIADDGNVINEYNVKVNDEHVEEMNILDIEVNN